MKLHRWISAIAVLIIVFSVALIASPFPAMAAPSSYQYTCDDIELDGSVLSATCLTRSQDRNSTSITLRGIENIDGTLKVVDPRKIANFNLSCRRMSISGDMISGECQKINGDWVRSRTRINGIENIDGELEYTSSPA